MADLRTTRTERLGLVVIEPPVFGDARGWFQETWNARRHGALGLPGEWVQDNVSLSGRGILRGMHFQEPNAQGKLVCVLRGEVLDVAVDVRVGSPTFGRWDAVRLSEANHRQLWLPEGLAHGFLVLSDEALFAYKVSGGAYDPASEVGLAWDDPEVAIEWPRRGEDGRPLEPILSPKDRALPRLGELVASGRLPRWNG